MKKLFLIGILLLSLVFLSTACQKKEDWEKQKTSNKETSSIDGLAIDQETKENSSSIEPKINSIPQIQEVKNFNIVASQNDYTPNTISVNKGNKVVINLTSEDVAYGFAITEYNISEIIPAGTTRTIEFIANKQGIFKFKNSVKTSNNHLEMAGNLIVN